MKKTITLVLAVILALGLFGCGGNAPAANPSGESTPTQPTEPTVENGGFLTVAQVKNLPVATDSMSKTELRQLILDYFDLQLTFRWQPSMDILDYDWTNYKNADGPKTIEKDKVYAGIPYQSKALGNLYRWLEYYDQNTGVFDFETMFAENGGYGEGAAMLDQEYDADGKLTYKKYRSMMYLFNQCSGSASWAWGRVINSVKFGSTAEMTGGAGLIPVGCYEYGYSLGGTFYGVPEIDVFGNGKYHPNSYTTAQAISDIVDFKGEDYFYECYGYTKPADALVRNGHVMMVRETVINRSPNGQIDPKNSYIIAAEQIENWAGTDSHNGKELVMQGRAALKYSFANLKKSGYLPFTFVELLDENDPQDKWHLDYYNSYKDRMVGVKDCYTTFTSSDDFLGASVEKAYTLCTATGDSITAADFEAMVVGANYAISDVFVTVTDPSGALLLKNTYRAETLYDREIPMTAGVCSWELDADGNRLPISNGVAALADGQNTVTVKVQISTGELLTAFEGTLTK